MPASAHSGVAGTACDAGSRAADQVPVKPRPDQVPDRSSGPTTAPVKVAVPSPLMPTPMVRVDPAIDPVTEPENPEHGPGPLTIATEAAPVKVPGLPPLCTRLRLPSQTQSSAPGSCDTVSA